MRLNLPVTQNELDFPADQLLVSMTDTKGIITHCNQSFVRVSGYSYEELIAQNHNLIRHPDMPAVAFKDMWRTVGRGKSWTGLVKNRCANGDHYWVKANVTPILRDGKPQSYMSVRTKPSRDEIQAAQALYAQINASEATGASLPFYLHEGNVVYKGLRGFKTRFQMAPAGLRIGLVTAAVIVPISLSPYLLGIPGVLPQLAAAALCCGLVTHAIVKRFIAPLRAIADIATDLSSCNLTNHYVPHGVPDIYRLIGALEQTRVNLKAIVHDIGTEMANFTQAAADIAAGSVDLSARTEAQASSLEETAASMGKLSSTVSHTADTAQLVSAQSLESTAVATRGGVAVHKVGQAMEAMDASSTQVRDIIGVIEGIAFQTNLLALNAAVEAARAGEQGRGFAVVAGEVRALAQRSGVAAKEIRGLIAHSVEQIHEGTQQMQSAASTIDEVVNSVKTMGNLIDGITSATKEQAVGIAQVNDAVSQLDTVTLQNAALVEASAASARTMSTGVHRLARSIQVFTVQ